MSDTSLSAAGAFRPPALDPHRATDNHLRRLHNIMTGTLTNSNSSSTGSDSPSPSFVQPEGKQQEGVSIGCQQAQSLTSPKHSGHATSRKRSSSRNSCTPIPEFTASSPNAPLTPGAESLTPNGKRPKTSKDNETHSAVESLDCMSIKRYFSKPLSAELEHIKDGLLAKDSILTQKEARLQKKEADLAHRENELSEAKSQIQIESQKLIDGFKSQVQNTQRQLEDERQKSMEVTIKLLRDIAQKEKLERYQRLVKDNVRIGSVTTRRDGHIIREVWEEGEIFRNFRERQSTLKTEKEELEAEKKYIMKLKSNLSNFDHQLT